MFILINGSFGIGKTTASKRLANDLRRARIADPEDVGFVLHRLPPWALGLGERADDYQDMALWRWLIVLQARFAHRRAPVVIVPMAFTNRDYFAAFTDGLGETASVAKICLVAQLGVVRDRLTKRALAEGRSGLGEFELRRSAECVAAHADPFFGLPVDAMQAPDQVVADIRAIAGV